MRREKVRYMSKKVLIVDDEEDIQDILKAQLQRIGGIEVVNALGGEEGVKIYKDLFGKGEEPTLVVMDLNLSGKKDDLADIDLHMEGKDKKMDGVRTTQEILKINPKAVIWGYTAWFGTQWAEKLKETGAIKVVDRMVPFKEFANMINMFLHR